MCRLIETRQRSRNKFSLDPTFEKKTCMTSTLKDLITDLAKNCVQIRLERITTNHISTMIIETKLDKSRNMFLPLKT